MSAPVALAASGGIAALVALATVLLLRRPLEPLLTELCGGASFWLVFTSITLVLVALLGILVSFPLGADAWSAYPQLPHMVVALRTSLAFLLVALATLGVTLLRGIAEFERRGGAPPATR